MCTFLAAWCKELASNFIEEMSQSKVTVTKEVGVTWKGADSEMPPSRLTGCDRGTEC